MSTQTQAKQRKWTDHEDRILVANQFASMDTLCRELGRTMNAVQARRKMLRAQGRIQ